MKTKKEFNWELYQSGNYDCITRDGRKVEQLHKFECTHKFPLTGILNNVVNHWTLEGYYNSTMVSSTDLFLIQKEHIVEANEMIIPTLGEGVLMEVSDYDDFSFSVSSLVYAKLFDGYVGENIGKYLKFFKYARPIQPKEELPKVGQIVWGKGKSGTWNIGYLTQVIHGSYVISSCPAGLSGWFADEITTKNPYEDEQD